MRKTLKRTLAFMLTALMLFGAGTKVNAESQIQIIKTDIVADSVVNCEGYACLKVNEKYDDKYRLVSFPQAALVDSNGKFLFPYKNTWLSYYVSDEVVSLVNLNKIYDYYYISDNDGESYIDLPKYYDINGNELFKNTARFSSPMINGYAFIIDGYEVYNEHNAKAYLVDKKGQKIYTFPKDFSDSVSFGGGLYVEGAGFAKSVTWPNEGLIGVASTGCNYCEPESYIDFKGNTLISLSGYSSNGMFSDGLAKVMSSKNEKYGFINAKGTEVIACQFDACSNFKNGYCCASKNNKWGYIDKTGKTVIPFEYDDCYGAGSGLFAVVKNGKCGLVDINNSVVVPFDYDDISSATGGVAYAIKNRKLYIIKVNNDAQSGKISVLINDFELKYKNVAKLIPTINVADGVKYSVEYKSLNPSVATVDKDGNVIAVGRGDTLVTCKVTDENGNVAEDSCGVNVYYSFGQWLIKILLLGFLWY